MNEVYLSLGCNIGNRREYLNNAKELISEISSGEIVLSKLYESESWGFEADKFLNIVIKIQTCFDAYSLLKKLQEIEKILGRENKTIDFYESRKIDIDILYFNNDTVSGSELTIPHKFLHLRKFVLKPLNDISPNFTHPILKKTNEYLLQICVDNCEVRAV